jgi:hypothetical protein
LIIPYFGLIFRNCVLSDGIVCRGRTKNQVEVALEGGGDGFDAAGAEDLKVGLVAGAEADVVDVAAGATVLDEEVSLAFDRHGAKLADVGSVVEGTGGDGLVDPERLVYELNGGYEHYLTVCRLKVTVKSGVPAGVPLGYGKYAKYSFVRR